MTSSKGPLSNRLAYLITLLSVCFSCLAQTEGYYKDLFMDGGVGLTSRTTLPAADSLGLSWEYLASESQNMQNAVIIGSDMDSNGWLLYPDGAPRFRTIYVNGGDAVPHYYALGEAGVERIQAFYSGGSGYVGTCAGAILSEIIWPGVMLGTGITGAGVYTGHFISPNSALLNYSTFGDDMYISNIFHWGGVYADESNSLPPGTEILLRYDYTQHPSVDQRPSCWTYKENDTTGRMLAIGSHPEGEILGEGLMLMESLLLYALDGCAPPEIKATLVNGEPRVMDKTYEESNPQFTRIGDLQYHHYSFEVPEEAGSISIELEAGEQYDIHLFADPDDYAFSCSAEASLTSGGSDHYFVISDPEPGTWFIGVKGATTVEFTGISQLYIGDLSVLNGVEYTITASWHTSDVTSISQDHVKAESLSMLNNFPNPFNPTTTIEYETLEASEVKLMVTDIQGHHIRTLVSESKAAGRYTVQWNGIDSEGTQVGTGIYFARIQSGNSSRVIKMIYLR